MDLGKLEKVSDLRTVWKNEASDFTNWLAQDENIKLLSDELDMDITVDETQASNGRYYADILAHDESSEDLVSIIIENQLEATNHDHLGKIIVYASGLDAKVQIWVVKEVRDEHKQAVEWLNEHSDNNINIFLVKVELWRIDTSRIAPKFQVVSRTNDWTKSMRESISKNISATNLTHLHFWEGFKDFCEESEANFSLGKAAPQHWYDIRVGRSGCHVGLTYNVKKHEIACELYISDDKDLYYELERNKDTINSEISPNLIWMPLEEKKASRIKLASELDVGPDGTNWEAAFEWLKNEVELFARVLPRYWQR